MDVLLDILAKREADKTYPSGGDPHRFVELFGGRIVPYLDNSPDPTTFRDNYYYNTRENNLYVKVARWVDLGKELDNEDDNHVYINNRPIRKHVRTPDPFNYGDTYFYSVVYNKVYGKSVKWSRSTMTSTLK